MAGDRNNLAKSSLGPQNFKFLRTWRLKSRPNNGEFTSKYGEFTLN